MFDFNLFPNIESIVDYKVINTFRVEELLLLGSSDLKKLNLIEYSNDLLLSKVMQKFEELTHLTITTQVLREAFKDFAFHQNLKELVLGFTQNEGFEDICDSLKEIAIKCPKLKRIWVFSAIILKNISEVKQFFLKLEAFPSLKRMDITLMDETDIQTNQWFSFELFEGFPQKLTQLSFYLYDKPLNESVLKDIDIYLPKLQEFCFYSPLKTDSKGLTEMADILSRLSTLQTIKLRFRRDVDYQPIKAMIIEKCLKIKTIELFSSN